MNIITFLFYAGCALFFLGIAVPYLEIVTGVCALIIAAKSL
jgi:hypothetical protein